MEAKKAVAEQYYDYLLLSQLSNKSPYTFTIYATAADNLDYVLSTLNQLLQQQSFVTPKLKDKVLRAEIYKDERFSDHAPLIMDYAWE